MQRTYEVRTLRDRIAAMADSADGGVIVVASEDLKAMLDKHPETVTTEWGIRSPWGAGPAESRESAEQIIKNMRQAGHDAYLLWRGVTEWQVNDGD